jgi:hypothetical protein
MSTFEYDAVGHRYLLDGTEIPGVTRVLSDVLMGGKQWADEAAMWRGSVVHSCCELDDRGTLDEATVDPAARGFLDAWRRFKAEMRPEIFEVEIPRLSEKHRYAGRPDRVVFLNKNQTVLDIKSGGVGVATGIQLAAYCELTATMERAAVRLEASGRYTLTQYSVRDLRRDHQVFLSALAVWNWRKERRLL